MNRISFQTFLCQVTNKLSVPLSAALLIEILSSLQIIHLLFSTMAKFSPSSHFIITSLSKNLRYLTGAFPLEETTLGDSLLHSIWIICLIYLVSHLGLLLVGIKSGSKRLLKILSWVYLLHSRLLFFPIQFFLLNLCDLYTSSKDPSNTAFYQQAGWFIGSWILLVVNASLALCKEFVMYRVNHIEDDYYAVKTNVYHQMMLIYKIIALLFNFWGSSEASTASKGSTVLHLIIGSFLLLILFMKLPFYKFWMLKMTIILSTMILCLSGISLIYVFVDDGDSEASGGLHILVLLFPTLGIKLVLSRFQSLFKRILQGDFMVSEHAIHFGLLLEDFLLKERISGINYGSFFPTREDYYGVLTLAGDKIPLEKLTDRKVIHECELPIYLYIIEKLSGLVNKASSSNALAIYIAQISLAKVNNIPKALEILRKLESSSDSSSISMKNSIQYLNDLLEKGYNEDDSGDDNRLHLSHYFKYYDIANAVKSLMLTETNKQIQFWQEIGKRDLDAKKLYDSAQEIDSLFMRIRKECELNLNNFRKNCTSPMLLYAVYLNSVRQMQAEGIQVLKSFQSIMFAQNGNNELEAASGNVAVVVVSLDKAKAGIILNASGSIHNIFSHKKTDLIGKKIGCLFPNSIAKMYQQNIQEYAKTPEYKLDSKEKTFGKTSSDEFLELEVHFQLYPYVNKELTLMIVFKKLDEPSPILLANGEGNIVDCSRTLEILFHKESLNLKTFHSLKNLNSALEDANVAFNTVYGQNPQPIPSVRSKSGWFSFENTAVDFEETCQSPGRSLLHGFALSPDRDRAKKTVPTSGIIMPLDKAESLCGEYQEGKQVFIKKSQVRAHVNIKVLRVDEEIYKIVRINNLKKDIKSIFESSDENRIRTFGDEFPSETEKASIKRFTVPLKTPKTKGTIGSSFAIDGKKAILVESEYHDGTQEVQQELQIIHQAHAQDEGSSVRSSHYAETRTVRTLRNIGSRKKIQRSLCSLQIVLYVLIAVVLVLSFVKFELSKDSIEEIEKGINIINLATQRLQNVINTFLWSLLYFTRINSSLSTSYLTICLEKFTQSSKELETELGFLTDQELFARAFRKDVKFWQLAVQGDANQIMLDTFAASNILMTKYIAIHEAQNIFQIIRMPDILLIFNNTANDYLISSNKLISATDVILGEIISGDIRLLKVVLSIEMVALVCYVAVFVIMIYIISKSYERLGRALIRTQEGAVTQRIAQLNKVKILLEDDVERKGFIQDGFDLFNEERSSNKVKNVKVKNTHQQSNVQMSSMNKYLLRVAIICLIFIPMFAGLFIGTLVKSIHTFTTLESVNEELSMLSDGSLQSNLMMSTLIYTSIIGSFSSMLFMNQAPALQVDENFKNFNNLNQRLIDTFLTTSDGREIDPFMVEILQSNVCGHLSEQSKILCRNGTNYQKMGLLSMNTDYYNTLQNLVASIGLKTNLANALVKSPDILNKVIGEMNALMEIYPIIMEHVIEGFEETVQDSKNDERTEIIAIFATMIVYVVFIYWKPLKDLQRVDIGRRKILKVIPFSIFQENKALKFYLIQDFKTEVEEIKNKL